MKTSTVLEYIRKNYISFKDISMTDVNEIENQWNHLKELHPEVEEFDFFLLHNLKTNNFKTLRKLIEAKDSFPKKTMGMLSHQIIEKLAHAEIVLKPPFSDFSKILFLKDGYFYRFLNQLKNPEIEEQLKSVLRLLNAMYEADPSSDLAAKSFVAMNNYRADDTELTELIQDNKFVTNAEPTSFISKKNTYHLIYLAVTVFVIFRVALFIKMVKPFDSNETDYEYHPETEYHQEPPKIDRYYTQMHFQIDSFFVFLTDFKKEEIKQLQKTESLQSGQNPFETFYQSPPPGESSNFIQITNDTAYDMVLLENAMVYDTIKLPKSAYFIASGKTIDVVQRETDAYSVFNMYLGKHLASFQTKGKNLFIRNHSVVEYRFSELVPSARAILDADYSITRNATVSLKNGLIKITY